VTSQFDATTLINACLLAYGQQPDRSTSVSSNLKKSLRFCGRRLQSTRRTVSSQHSAIVTSDTIVEFAVYVTVDSVWPLYGPVAGDTRVTITGQSVNKDIVTAVYIGQNHFLPDTNRSDVLSTDW